MGILFRAIITTVGGFPRPQLNISSQIFAEMMDEAVGFRLVPRFDPYFNSINYLLASYVIPYVGLVGYVGTIPNLGNQTSLSVRTRNPSYLPPFSLMYMKFDPFLLSYFIKKIHWFLLFCS